MARKIVCSALLSLVVLHFTLALQETLTDFHNDSPRKVQTPQERDSSRLERSLPNLEDSEEELPDNTPHSGKHRLRRDVFSWFASYFQSDSETTEEPELEQTTENIDQSTETLLNGDHQITTTSKPGKEKTSPHRKFLQNQPDVSSSKPDGKNVKVQGSTREPRSTESSAITEFFKKVNPQTWLTTVSAFLHNGVDIDKLQTGSSELLSTGISDSSTPQFISPLHGIPTEASPPKKHKPHRIRHHKHHPNKVRVESPPHVSGGRDGRDDIQKVTDIGIDSSLHGRLEQGPHLGEEKHPETERHESKPRHCKDCKSSEGSKTEAGSKSMTEEEVKFLRKNMVAELMMQKLRLDPRDLLNMNTNKTLERMKLPMLPRAVLDETRERNSLIQEEDDFFARDQEAIVAGEDMGRDCVGMRSTGCYDFKFNGEVKGEVESAELWLYKTHDRRDSTEQTFIVYELERPRGSSFLRRRNLIAREGTSTKEGWVKLNVTRPVRRWLEKRRNGEMLAIRCKTCETHNYRAIFGTKHGYKPLLIIKYMDKYNRRIRRSGETCNPSTECCKRPLTVNFHEINLPTIMHPLDLSIGYCYGFCDGIDSFTYNHTSIKQQVRWRQNISDDTREQLKPCCVPIRLLDTSILSVENGIIVGKILPKVIVDRCGCV